MGIIAKQSLYNTIISYIGVFLGIILTLWLYVTILTPAEYGLTRIMISVAFIGAQFADFGIKNITIRYFPFFRDEKRGHHGYLFWALAISTGGFLLMALLMYLFKPTILYYYGQQDGLMAAYFDITLLLTFFTLLFSVLSSYIHSLFNTHFESLLQDIILRLFIIITLFAYQWELVNQAGFITLFVWAYGLLPVIILLYLIFRGKLFLKPDLSFFRIKPLKEMAKYGLYVVLGGITTLIVGKIDLLMLGALAGLTDTGIYAIAFYIGSVISIPQRSVNKIARPVVAQSFKTGDMQNIETVYRKSALTQLILGALLMIGIYANLPNLAAIIPANYFKEPAVVTVIGLTTLFNMATGINGVIILNSVHYRFDLAANLFLLVLALVTNYLLIPVYGILGAALATALSVFVYNTAKYIFVWVKLGMQPFTLKTLYVLLLALSTLAINNWALPVLDNHWLDLLVRSGFIAVIYMGSVIGFKLSSDINDMYHKLISAITNQNTGPKSARPDS